MTLYIVFVRTFQEQGADLEVVFKCKDGEQRCSRMVLMYNSDFFSAQLKGRDNMGNPPVFKYDFEKITIRRFLDWMHGLSVQSMTLVQLLELIKFLCFEAKKGKNRHI